MKKCLFKGVGTAIVTPLKNGNVDYKAFEILLERQVNAKIDAIIILGTTGEPCTLTDTERKNIIKCSQSICKNKTKLIVGCGSNNTVNAEKYYKMAETLGADGALIVTPYYNKCTQQGIIEHYKKIASSGNLPIITYNVPSRTGVNILPQTMKELANIKNISGIKEASGNVGQMLEYMEECDNISVYSGEDALNGIFYGAGADGAISVLSNIVPKLTKRVYDLFLLGEPSEAVALQGKLLPLIKSLFLEVNPIPVKAGLCYLGLCKNELRLPLTEMSEENFLRLKTEINNIWELENDCL